jgi:S-formylglutathione hydrolase
MKITSEQKLFDGTIAFYSHSSTETKTEMKFAVFVPPQARTHKVLALYYLAGLTCGRV